MTRLTLVFLFIALAASAQNPEVNRYLGEARKAIADKDYPAAYEALHKAQLFHPYHQAIFYNLGVMAALTGRPDESIENLRKALYINAGYKLGIEELATVQDRPDFGQLLELQKELQTVVVHSDTAFVLKDRSLHVESIAMHPTTGTCYVGSVHKRKIVEITKTGTVTDFTSPGDHGLSAVLGLRVDPTGKFLWACSSPMEEMENYDSLASSRVFKYDLKTRKLLAQFELVDKGHVFGDLVIGRNGEVLVSDSRTNSIYRANEATKSLDYFFDSSDFWNIQGITFSDDGKYLFISDYIKGPFRLELNTKHLTQLHSQVDNSLKGIDGLLYYKGTLIALQNGTSPLRAMRFTLNANKDTIVKAEIIDQAHPAMNEPTQGTIIGDELYYVATSLWSGYDDKHQIKPASELQDIVVLKYKLK